MDTTPTSQSADPAIRSLAYLLWKQAGCPDDMSLEFWLEAESQIKALQPPADPAVPEPPSRKPVNGKAPTGRKKLAKVR